MIIILKNIPKTVKEFDVRRFIEPVIQGGWFRRKGYIESIIIREQKDLRDNAIEYHALIRINPDTAAARAIKRLNGKPLKGKRVAVNEFFLRTWRNDPRINRQVGKLLNDRRHGDRRRYHLETVEYILYDITHAENRDSTPGEQ